MLDTMQVLGIFQNQLGGALPVLVRTSLEIYPVTWILLGSVYTLCFRAFLMVESASDAAKASLAVIIIL